MPLVIGCRAANVNRFRCQRKKGTLGKGLGKTTGWIHRTSLKKHGKDVREDVRTCGWNDQKK